MYCQRCGTKMVNIGGIGFQPRYKCPSTACPTNQLRHLTCPVPGCGKELREAPIGIGHQMYTCPEEHFGFDSLGQVAAPYCSECDSNVTVSPTRMGFRFTCRCPGKTEEIT